MSRLLAAGFARLKKSRIFWILIIFMAVLGFYVPIQQYFEMKKYETIYPLDDCLFMHFMFMGILIAVFCSLFVGTEYSDGTIRNKLIIGHSRIAIYLSNLVVCAVAGIAISLAFMAACVGIGIPLLGFFKTDVKQLICLILCDCIIIIAYTAIFTFFAMLIHNKAILATVTIISAFLLLFAATYLYSSLSQPEMRSDYAVSDYVTNESAQIIQTELVPNKYYVRGAKRKIYEFLMEFLPSGQEIILLTGTASLVRICLYDALIIIATTGVGIWGFLKKDIK